MLHKDVLFDDRVVLVLELIVIYYSILAQNKYNDGHNRNMLQIRNKDEINPNHYLSVCNL